MADTPDTTDASDADDTGGEPVPRLHDRREQLRERLAGAEGLLLCLDFDGTLAPIVDDPDDAAPVPGNRELLAALREHPDVEVGIVSGRAVADLHDRVDVAGVHYAGNHGIELCLDGEYTVAEDAQQHRDALGRAVERLRDELADVPGCVVEDKQLTATVHYRRVPDDRAEAVRRAVAAAVAEFPGLYHTHGKQVVELRPDVDAGKDRAVRRLREAFPGYLPVFVGDDTTDEDAFREIADAGVGIHVGDGVETASSLRLRDPEDVQAFLRWLVDACGQRLGNESADA